MKHIRHTKHYWRAAFLIVGSFIAFLIFRAFLIPPTFGEYGFYRGANVQEQMDKKVYFAKKGACAECHDDMARLHKQNSHAAVQCQNCHAPLAVHIEEGEFIGEMPINSSPKLCLQCHRALPSRPKDFPQIDVKNHLATVEQNLESGQCLQCHNPHDPTPQ